MMEDLIFNLCDSLGHVNIVILIIEMGALSTHQIYL